MCRHSQACSEETRTASYQLKEARKSYYDNRKFSEEDKIQYNIQQKFIMNHINSVQSVCVPYEQL